MPLRLLFASMQKAAYLCAYISIYRNILPTTLVPYIFKGYFIMIDSVNSEGN